MDRRATIAVRRTPKVLKQTEKRREPLIREQVGDGTLVHDQGDLEITDYWDEPGLYTVSRVKCTGCDTYELPRFAFYTVVEGAGVVNDVPLKKGETVLVPAGTGELRLEGALDGFVASYRNEKGE